MPHGKLIRSTPFRLAITFAAAFITASMIAGIVVFGFVQTEIDKRYDSKIKELFAGIVENSDASNTDKLAEIVRNQVYLNPTKDNVFQLQNERGTVIAGNISEIEIRPGWTTVPSSQLGIKADYGYRMLKGRYGDSWLTVGSSREDQDEIREIALAGFGWATLVVIFLALAGGAVLARRAQRRLDAVAATLNLVSRGNLDTRIPLLGRGDDIDRLASQINDALDRLTRLVDGMRQVSNDIAHDLRTPLSRVQQFVDHALNDVEAGTSVYLQLEAASRECNQIAATFAALLRIAQIEAGARKASFQEVDLVEVINDINNIYKAVAEDAGISLRVDISPRKPMSILGDRELLVQLFANLIENAIVHSSQGTQINCRLTPDGAGVSAIVADDGPGIPANERANVLRRLYRLEKSRTTPGSGLGLSLAKAIIDLHGASLVLDDNKPGLKIQIVFPTP